MHTLQENTTYPCNNNVYSSGYSQNMQYKLTSCLYIPLVHSKFFSPEQIVTIITVFTHPTNIQYNLMCQTGHKMLKISHGWLVFNGTLSTKGYIMP